LGSRIEFWDLQKIRKEFPDGIRDLHHHYGLRGPITDDTQMTLFTAEGIIRAEVGHALTGINRSTSLIHHALLRWYRTQNLTPLVETDDVGLITYDSRWGRRAPGVTIQSALGSCSRFGEKAKNDSKGCGTIMRVAPVALMLPRERVRPVAMETSALTHEHPTGQLAAAAWAETLADVAAGAALEDSATGIAGIYERMEGGSETARAIRAALEAPRDGIAETVETLGKGWIAEEALSIALYACLAATSFEEALRIAVTHSGDSDSTGAIAGNMLGLIYPEAILRHPWAEAVEGSDIITRLVGDYLRLKHDSGSAEELADIYPGT